jgi:membrane-bound ClpP family serine protease
MTYVSPSVGINATKGFGEVLNYTNSVTDNWLSNLFLIGIYVLILIGFYKARNDFTGALAVAGYGTFVIALFFWIGGFISGFALGWVIAIAIIGTILLFVEND